MKGKKFVISNFKTICVLLIVFTMLYNSMGNLIQVVVNTNRLNKAYLGEASVTSTQAEKFYSGWLTGTFGFSAKNEKFDPDSLELTPEKII